MLNLFLIGSGASGAVPFGTMMAILALYFLISGPLCVAGYLYGMRHGVGFRRQGPVSINDGLMKISTLANTTSC